MGLKSCPNLVAGDKVVTSGHPMLMYIYVTLNEAESSKQNDRTIQTSITLSDRA